MSNPPGISGIKSIVRKQILENIVRTILPGKWKILIVDKAALKVVNSACKMNELMEENITLVEPLEKRRQPYPTMDAIYIVSPGSDSVLRIIEDFTRNKYNQDGKLYASAHLFFTSALDDRLFHRLKSSSASHHIKTLREVYMDFVAVESQVFTLERPYSLVSFFGTEVTGDQLSKEYGNVARQLASFCITLGEFPHIRYSTFNNFDRITSKLAALTYEELDRYAKSESDFPVNDAALLGANRATLVIVDRSIDVLATLVHDFTYQAMANDLLRLSENGTKYKYVYSTASEGKKEKEVLLDESDSIWRNSRHVHISECVQILVKDFNHFLEGNTAAAGMANGKKGVQGIKELKDMLTAVPQFQDLKSKFGLHMTMSQECMAAFTSKKLDKIAAIEQDLATGTTADGSVPKHIEVDMVPLLDDPDVAMYDKVRLLMLYIIAKEGVKDEDRRKLFEHARISSEMTMAITNLVLVGVKLAYSKQKKSAKKNKKSNKKDDDDAYDLSRYVPVLKGILGEICDGSFDKSCLPYIKDPSMPDTYGAANLSAKRSEATSSNTQLDAPTGGAPAATSLRSTKPSWHNRKTGSDASASMATEKKEEERKKGGKIILFVVGGMTFSEIRSVYELGQEYKKDIIIGSTHIITPNQMVDDIKTLRSPLVIPDSSTPINAEESRSMATLQTKKKKGIKGMIKNIKTKLQDL